MHQVVEVGDHLLAIDSEQKYDPVDAAKVIGFYVRVIVTRLDGAPVRGSMRAEDSGELTDAQLPWATVGDAMAHGEAWGRHFVARILGGHV
jgi:hypothetical protein